MNKEQFPKERATSDTKQQHTPSKCANHLAL